MKYTGNYFHVSGPFTRVLALVPGLAVADVVIVSTKGLVSIEEEGRAGDIAGLGHSAL